MASRRFHSLLAGVLLAVSASSWAARLLVQSSPLAGFSHHAAAHVWPQLREGDELTLIREQDNPADPLAVRVQWREHVLGYLPRIENGPLAQALERGMPISARIGRLREHRNPRQRVLIDVFVGLAPRP